MNLIFIQLSRKPKGVGESPPPPQIYVNKPIKFCLYVRLHA